MRYAAIIVLVFFALPVAADAHGLSAERAAHRARFFLRDLERQSHVFTRSSVATSSCVRENAHRRRCTGRLSGHTAEGQPASCVVGVAVRFRDSVSYGTVAKLVSYDCRRG